MKELNIMEATVLTSPNPLTLILSLIHIFSAAK